MSPIFIITLLCCYISKSFMFTTENKLGQKEIKYLFDSVSSSSEESSLELSTYEEDKDRSPQLQQPLLTSSQQKVINTQFMKGKEIHLDKLDSDLKSISDYENVNNPSSKNDYAHDDPDNLSLSSKPDFMKPDFMSGIEKAGSENNENDIHSSTQRPNGESIGGESDTNNNGYSPSQREKFSVGVGDDGAKAKVAVAGEMRRDENSVGGEQQEKLLLQKLMAGYERDVRPVINASHPIVVRVGITLTQIFDMDEKNQVLETNVWLDQEWTDELLQWDPEDYGGLDTIRLPCERIWLPDVLLYNNADDYTRGYMPSRAMVKSNGHVFWPPPTKFRSTCVVDVTFFPFDDQVCFLKLGSWTYNGLQVDVTNRTSGVDLSNYVQNGEWELVKAVQQRNVVYYSCCPEPFPDVTVTLVIRRKTLYYIYNILLPCIMLSSLTLLVFQVPPDSGEKIALGITVLLAFSVFMLAINESLPQTSESIPLIGVYLTIIMGITSISILMTIVVLNLHYLGPQVRPLPKWLLYLLPKNSGKSKIRQKSLLIPVNHREPKSGSLKRAHIFITKLREGGESGDGYSIEVPEEKLEGMMVKGRDIAIETVATNDNSGKCSFTTRRRLNSHSDTNFHQTAKTPQQQQTHQSTDVTKDFGEADPNVLEELLVSIKQLINKQEEIETQNNLVAEWRLVAQEVDKILFWIFFTFTLVSSTFILLVLPIYKRSWYGTPSNVFNDTDLV